MEKEPGYTQIPHAILEHLMKMHLSPNQWQVLLCIFRKTYGFHKKVDYIANKQIVEATGLCKSVVSRMLHDLNDMKLISREGKYIGVQEDWGNWEKLAGQSTLVSKLAEQSTSLDNKSKQNSQQELAVLSTELAEQSTKVSSCAVTQKIKDTITKDTIQKKVLPPKKKYGEFKNVLLSDDEYQKLKDKFGAKVPDMIETLSSGIESHGYKYHSHYATILNWKRRDEKEKGGQDGAHRGHPGTRQLPTKYRTPEEIFGSTDA